MSKQQPRARYPYLYLPDGWDTGWQAAKAAAGATPAQIMFFGDSVQSGTAGVSDWKKTYPHLLREALKASLGGLKSDYFPAWGLSLTTGAAVVGTPPWSALSATTPSGRTVNLGWHSLDGENAAGAQAGYMQTFTSYDACTALDLFYTDYNSGTFVYSLDGGGDVTVTCTNAASNILSPTKKISLTGLANTTHTVAIGKQSAAGVCLLMGIATHNSALAGGLQIARFCNGSATMAGDYVTTGQVPATPFTRLEFLSGCTPQGGGGTGTAFGFPMQPHLLIFELGVNDCAGSNNQTDFQTALRRMIQALRKGRPNASILFHLICNPDTNVSDNTSNLFVPANWYQWMEMMIQFAGIYNCAFLNTHAKWGETPVASGFQTIAANVHPTDAGQADIAADLLKIL
jgi:GDSL-like Lipase/Acylhydrolase family